MFEKPTFNDFLDQLRMHNEEVFQSFQREKDRVLASASQRGGLHSGATVDQLLQAIETALHAGTSRVLGETRRAINTTDLDRFELRHLAISRLNELASLLLQRGDLDRIISGPTDNLSTHIQQRIDALKSKLNFWIRQFDIGFDEPAKAEPIGHVTNILNARDITGAFQQGQGTLTQTTEIKIDTTAARQAVANLESELPGLKLSVEVQGELESDLDTIKAQLRKPNPSTAILREAGRSVRNITEGVVAGMLTPQGVAASLMLARAIGI